MTSVMERAAPYVAEADMRTADVGVSTLYLCSAPYLRESMISRTAAGQTSRKADPPGEELVVGRAFCRRALSDRALTRRMTAVDVDDVIRHAHRGWRQVVTRDLVLAGLLLASTVLAPLGTAVWLLLGAFVLKLPWAWKRWRRRRRSLALLLVLCVLAIVEIVAHGGSTSRVLLTPIGAVVGCLAVYYVDSVACWFRIRHLPRSLGRCASDRLGMRTMPTEPMAPEGVDRQNVVVYERDRIVGVGDGLGKHTLTVPIDEPAKDEKIKRFEAPDLLRFVSEHLSDQGVADSITHALPDLRVDRVMAVPIRLMTDAHERIVDDELLNDMLVNPPSGSVERVYARAQATTWHGEVMGTIFVSVALEGRFLRLVVLPYILGPIAPELHAADAILKRGLTAHLFASLTLAVREFSLAVRTARSLVSGFQSRGQASQPAPTSKRALPKTVTLRERYSVEASEDLHQAEDGTRIVQIMEQRVFSVTEIFLKDHGIATRVFEQQVSQVLNSYVIIGSNNNMAAGQNSQAGDHNSQAGQP